MKNKIISLFLFLIIFSFLNGCAGMAASAEEYYTIGMAYFDNGKYEEAEMWLNRARQADRTMTASVYNLGRIAFERQRYREAASHFENILEKDPDNVLALKAAAFTRIRTGDLEIASRHYSRLLTLVPESADDGYNHALVLYAMGRYGEAENVLNKYPFALLENNDVMLLHARALKAQNKIEAIDRYSNILSISSDPKVRYEYAGILENYEFYARAIEEYRASLSASAANAVDPRRNEIQFAIAKAVLTADSADIKGLEELEAAVEGGFKNTEAVEALLGIENLSQANRLGIQEIISRMKGEVNKEETGSESENNSDSSS